METKKAEKQQNGFLMPLHPLTNFEVQKYYQNDPRFNGVYSRDNLPKIKDGAYVINLDEYSNIGTHWVALYIHNNDVTYFDSFGVEHIPKEIKILINCSLSIATNIFRIEAYDSIMWNIFVLDLLILCLQEKPLLNLLVFFHQTTLKK